MTMCGFSGADCWIRWIALEGVLWLLLEGFGKMPLRCTSLAIKDALGDTSHQDKPCNH